ncbi:MAG: cupin domain-containing protein [Bacteroidota bacterium]|nr:cupin domain-containing protein [Bacteroidota bacterium]
MKENNIKNWPEDKIIFNSLGLLDEEEKIQFKSTINNLTQEERNSVSEFNNLVSLFPHFLKPLLKEISPSPNVKKNIFEKINKEKKSDSDLNKTGFEFIFSDSNDWVQHPEIEGVKIKRLAVNEEKGYLMILMKAVAGCEYPSHHHSGAEECYVLEGDIYAEGKTLGPGDFHHAESGSDHDTVYTKNGCTLLLVVDPRDY